MILAGEAARADDQVLQAIHSLHGTRSARDLSHQALQFSW